MASSTKPPWIVRSLAEVARFFGVHSQTPREWRSAGMPGKKNEWDLAAILRWRDDRAVAKEELTPHARKALADAKIQELRYAKLEGSLVDVEAVRRLLVEHITTARALLDCIPEQVLGSLPASLGGDRLQTIRTAVRQTIDGACATLADALAARPFADDDSENDACEQPET